jgi:hypothetical protein
MNLTLKDIFEQFKKDNPDIVIDFKKFRAVIQDYLDLAVDKILMKGKTFHMGSNMSTLSIIRVERNYNKPVIDWPNTWKIRKQEKDTTLKVYHTSPWFYMVYWNKGKCKVPNKTVYNFKLVRGEKGNTKKILSLKEDSLAYRDFPLVKRYKKDGIQA